MRFLRLFPLRRTAVHGVLTRHGVLIGIVAVVFITSFSPTLPHLSSGPALALDSAMLGGQTCTATAFGEDPERRGCCSWHGGVCGCESGRAKCCDGTLSPSCGC